MRGRKLGGANPAMQPDGERIPRYVVVASGMVVVAVLLFAVALVLARRFASPAAEVPLASTGIAATGMQSAVPTATTPTSPNVASAVPTRAAGAVAPTREATGIAEATAAGATPIATLPSDEGHIVAYPPTSQLERDVEAAYLHYWDVRARALNDLDPTPLGDVESGPALAVDEKQIEELRSQGRALVIDVTHHVYIVRASTSMAEVYDQYDSHGYVVDAATKQRLGGPEPAAQVRTLRLLQRFDRSWKVTDAKIVQ